MMAMTLRPIPAGQDVIKAGTVVDASAWANMQTLWMMGQIRPLTPTELDAHTAPEPKKTARTRKATK